MMPWLLLLAAVAAGAGSLILFTQRLGTPPMPSEAAVRAAVLRLLGEQVASGRIVDLGSGWGGLAREAALSFPARQVVGLEASALPFLFSVVLRRLKGPANLCFRRLDFLKRPVPEARAYLCYLSPRTMRGLEEKVVPGLPGESVLISAVFALRGRPADRVLRCSDFYRSPVYLYRCAPPPQAQTLKGKSSPPGRP